MQTEHEIEEEVGQLIRRGQWFLAYDAARPAMSSFPRNLKLRQHAAHALLKVKAVEDARRILEPLCKPHDSHNPQLRQLYKRVQAVARHLDSPGEPPPQAMHALSELIDVAAQARESFTGMRATDVETIGLLAKAYKDSWRESGSMQDAADSRDTYLRTFENTGSVWMGINAATMSAALADIWGKAGNEREYDKEKELSRKLALRTLELCDRLLNQARGDDQFWFPATRGEALLLRGKSDEAIEQYKAAAARAGELEKHELRGHSLIVSVNEQLRLLLDIGVPVDPEILRLMKPPTVVVFAGHMLDRDDRPHPRFPRAAEIHIREKIDFELQEMDARIGYSSAACGSDILFIEAMLDRGAEVNILLPFEIGDFINQSVAHGGERWKRRFDRAIKLAGDHVTYATGEKFLNTHDLFAFADKVLASMAYLRARNMGSLPHLLAVYDGVSPVLIGGTADVVQRWPDGQRKRVIRPLPDGQAAEPASPADPASKQPQSAAVAATDAPEGTVRKVRTILFADVVGFSRMNEEQAPAFIFKFLGKLAEELGKLAVKPLMENTWGDAIVAVMEDAFPLVQYARTLQRVIQSTPWKDLGLPENMSVRIGLHAGPVFEGKDPITGRLNFFGSHVNRAARIEPVTLPGRIYASQQFMGLLTSELRSRSDDQWPFICEWLGTLDLAKGFGKLPIYHIRERRTGEPDVVSVARYDGSGI